MNAATWILNRLFGKRISRDTRRYLAAVASEHVQASRARTSTLLHTLANQPGPHANLGQTEKGEMAKIPLPDLISHAGLITAGSGGGKTMLTLLIVSSLLEASEVYRAGFAVVDGAKSDLFMGTLCLIQRRLEELSRCDPAAASKFRRRIRIIDFASTDVITEFNLLARWPGAEPDSFAGHQVDLLLDVIPDGDSLKLAAALLKTLVQIFSEPEIGMSVIELIRALDDEQFLNTVLARCRDSALVATLGRQLGTVSRSTRAALRRRLETLVSSKTVARMLAGRTAPDFRQFQDDSCFVLVNSAGANISGSLARFLNTLAVSYFCRSIYTRLRPELPFPIFADEAQDLVASPIMREHLSDASRLSRRFGSSITYITQNLSAAVSDARLLSLLHTNVGWTWSGRGDPADCAFLKAVLPATGRRPKPKQSPFEETRVYSIAEERSLLLEEIANLGNRHGYFWLKGRSHEAIKIRTGDLDIPQGRELEKAVLPIRNDPTIGQRLSRKEYDRVLIDRARKNTVEQHGDVGADLEQAYRRGRNDSEVNKSGA